jgi:magnesium transporter
LTPKEKLMLTRYSLGEDGFCTVPAETRASWLNLENPDLDEVKSLASKLNLPLVFLADPLDPKERPRLDQEGHAIMIITRIPHLEKKDEQPVFKTVPLGLILTPNLVVTVCRKPGIVLEFLGRTARRPFPKDRISLTFKILIECSSDFIHHLERLEEITDEAELTLNRAQQNEQIMTLLTIDKALINYTVALKSNRAIMQRLMDGCLLSLSPEENDLLERALTENQQAIFMADIFGQVLGSMGDAFGTIISNNLNKVMKLLTGVTIILMLPTLIVGAYGMNVLLPLANNPKAFWILCFICLAASVAILVLFWRKKWI